MPPRLQDRDLALLFFTWQSRYVAQRQYREKFWPTSAQSTVAQRLIELKEAHLLKSHALPWLRDRLLYSISIEGTKILASAGFPSVAIGDCPKPATDFTPGMKHDLDLVDLRTGCERAGHIIDWTSEHELRLARKQGKGPIRITDGIFRFEAATGESRALIEYERMGYRRSKYLDILNRLKSSQEHQAGMLVFFVCPTAQRAETLRQWATDLRSWRLTPDRIWFGYFEAIKAEGLAGGFVDLNSLPLVLPKLLD